VGTPLRPLPEGVARWGARARWLRRLDALVAGLLVWGLMGVGGPELTAGWSAALAGAVVAPLAAIPPLRLRWRPVSGPAGLWLSRTLVPGDRAWHVRPEAAELVIVTARRGFRLTVAVPGRGGAEGLSVRRTRVVLLSADGPPVSGAGH
jgi:hypothetical protein